MKSRVLTASVLAAVLAFPVATVTTAPLAGAETTSQASATHGDAATFEKAYERVQEAETAVADAQAAYDAKLADIDARAAKLNAEIERTRELMRQRQEAGDTAGYEQAEKEYRAAFFARYDFRYEYKALAHNEGDQLERRQEQLDQARRDLAVIELPAPTSPEDAAPYTVPDVVDVASELEYAYGELERKQQAYEAALGEVAAAQAEADPEAAAEAKAEVEALRAERSAKFLQDIDTERRRSEEIRAELARTSALLKEREEAGDAEGYAQAEREHQAALDAEQEFNQWRMQRIEDDKQSYAALEAAEEKAKAATDAVVRLGAVQAKAYAALSALVDERLWVEALHNAQSSPTA